MHAYAASSRAFSKSAVSDLHAMVEKEAVGRLISMISRGRQGDLVADFALPFALHVICDVLGLPYEDRMAFREWGDSFLGTSDVTRDEAARSAREMGDYLFEQIERRRAHATPDLLTQIAINGADLPPDVQVKLAITLVVGGWETTAGSIARFVYVPRVRRLRDRVELPRVPPEEGSTPPLPNSNASTRPRPATPCPAA